jgi:hypothetical protein
MDVVKDEVEDGEKTDDAPLARAPYLDAMAAKPRCQAANLIWGRVRVSPYDSPGAPKNRKKA